MTSWSSTIWLLLAASTSIVSLFVCTKFGGQQRHYTGACHFDASPITHHINRNRATPSSVPFSSTASSQVVVSVAKSRFIRIHEENRGSACTVLLIKSASIWFGRNRNAASGEAAELSTAQLQQWLQTRKSEPGLTLLSSRYLHVVQAKWRQQMDAILSLPMPYKVARKMMWRQAFAGISCSDTIDWSSLAAQLKVSGGEIQVLAEAAIAIAQSKKAKTMTIGHIQQAIKQRGLSVTLS